jgi:preprotein translocase subunit YajC
MFATPAFAQAASGAAAAGGGGMQGFLLQIAPIIVIFILFYWLLIRPQQQRAKEHQERIKAVKRGETVVLSNGMVGKITRVEETDAMVEIASGVNVRVVKSMIHDIRSRAEPAAPAADAKS